MLAFQCKGEGSGNGRREVVSIYLLGFDDVSTINVLNNFLLSSGRGSKENWVSALFMGQQDRKIQKYAFPADYYRKKIDNETPKCRKK